MADVINNMYLNYFYKVSEGYSRTLNLYKWHVSLHFYLTYHSVFPNPSLPPVMVVEGEGEAAWTLSLLHLILSSSFPFGFISSNLLPHSFPVGLLFSSVFFDLITKNYFVPISPLGPFWLYQVLVPDDVHQILPYWFPKIQRILSIISWLVKIINWYSAESNWQCRVSGLFIFHELTKNWAQS